VRIPLIFELEGEAGFRDREAAMIRELAARQGVVLATGGGAVLRAEKREVLYAERDPLYREVADFIIETGKPSVAQLANMVLMQLEMAGFPIDPPQPATTPSGEPGEPGEPDDPGKPAQDSNP